MVDDKHFHRKVNGTKRFQQELSRKLRYPERLYDRYHGFLDLSFHGYVRWPRNEIHVHYGEISSTNTTSSLDAGDLPCKCNADYKDHDPNCRF